MIRFAGKLVLPNRPHLDHLRKQAKARLIEMRAALPDACLADAQLALAQEYGFPSWGKLRAEVSQRAATRHDRRAPVRRRRPAFTVRDRAFQLHESPLEQAVHVEAQSSFFRSGAAANIGVVLIFIAVMATVWALVASIMG